MNCELILVGGRAEGEPGGVTDGEALIQSGSEGVKEGGVGGHEGGGRSSEEGDGAIGIDFGCEEEWEGAIGVLKDLSGNIQKWEQRSRHRWGGGGGTVGGRRISWLRRTTRRSGVETWGRGTRRRLRP